MRLQHFARLSPKGGHYRFLLGLILDSLAEKTHQNQGFSAPSLIWISAYIPTPALSENKKQSIIGTEGVLFEPNRGLWASQVALVVKNLLASAGDKRDLVSTPESGRSPGGGHSNPLQYSCLENPTDRGAWWATVYGVTQSRTRLK